MFVDYLRSLDKGGFHVTTFGKEFYIQRQRKDEDLHQDTVWLVLCVCCNVEYGWCCVRVCVWVQWSGISAWHQSYSQAKCFCSFSDLNKNTVKCSDALQ